MHRRILSRTCVVSAARCTCFFGAQFLYGDQTRPSVDVLGPHSGTFSLPSVPEFFAGRRQCRQIFSTLSHYPCFPQPLDIQEFWSMRLQHSVVSVADADCLLLEDRACKPSRACLVDQRPVHSRSVRLQHPEKSTLSLVWSLRVDRHLWRVACDACASLFFFPMSLSVKKVIVACMFMHGSSEQAVGVVPRCLVQNRIVCFVFAHIHGLACWLFILLLVHCDPAVSKSRNGIIEHDPQYR